MNCPFCSSFLTAVKTTATSGQLNEFNCLNTTCEVYPLYYAHFSGSPKPINYSLRVNNFWIKSHLDGTIIIFKMNPDVIPFVVKVTKPDFDPFQFVGKIDKLEEKLKTYMVFS